MSPSDPPDLTPDAKPPSRSDDVESQSAEVRDISIQQSFHQHVQLLFPSLIDAVEKLADSHPDIAHKIVDDVIRQGEHRQRLEEVVIKGDDRRSTLSQVLSWVFAMTALVGSIVLILQGQSISGFLMIIIALAPLVGVNIIGRNAARRERVEKARLAHQPPEVEV